MSRFMLLAFAVFCTFTLVVLKSTRSLDSPPAVDDRAMQQALAALEQQALDPTQGIQKDTAAAAIAAYRDTVRAYERRSRWMDERMMLTTVALMTFLCISSAAFVVVGFVAWNRIVHGIKVRMSLAFISFLDNGISKSTDLVLVKRVLEQLGLLFWYLQAAKKLTQELRLHTPPGTNDAVICEADRTLGVFLEKMRCALVTPVDPHVTELTELGVAVRQAEQARKEIAELSPALERMRADHRKLEDEVRTLQTTKAELLSLRAEAIAAERRAAQRTRELAAQEERLRNARLHLERTQSGNAATVREMKDLLVQLAAWEGSGTADPVQRIAADRSRYPGMCRLLHQLEKRSGGNGAAAAHG